MDASLKTSQTQQDSKPFLNVRQSLGGARWVLSSVDEGDVARMVQVHDIPDFVARMLCARGVGVDDVSSFLNPTLKDNFPDPFRMAGMKEFARDAATHILAGKKFGVFADFDVDGATSAAVLVRFLRACGHYPALYIPDRLIEGYGPNIQALQTLKDQGANIIWMADCGTTSFEVVEQARAIGLDVVIFDHHEAEEALPAANHVINPKRKDDESGFTYLAACGVCFLSCVAVNSVLRGNGFFADKNLPEPKLKDWLDLVALGTVCDMVPMIGANRLLVRSGLIQMSLNPNIGIRALCDVAGIEKNLGIDDLGFSLGPRINAGSRVHKSHLGARLLCADDMDEARSIAFVLDDCNEQRKKIQSQMMKEAIEQVEQMGHHNAPAIVVGHESWHAGLSGLVAGRLKDKYKKPSVVVTYVKIADGQMEGRGSGRSIAGVNIAGAFIDARNEGILVKGGGHAMAGGFTVMPGRLKEFEQFLMDHVSAQIQTHEQPDDFMIDAVATVGAAKPNLVKMITEDLGPFGAGHLEPMFALSQVTIHAADVLKDKHIRIQVSDWEGGTRMKAMMFYGVGTPAGDALLKGRGRAFHLAGRFKLNLWQGRESVEFMISDVAAA